MANVLITGANRGIGLALAREYQGRGDDVIAAVRRSSPELDALGVRVETDVDVGSDDAVRSLTERLGDTPLDVLVCNAGMLRIDSLDELDLESVRQQIDVNAVGALRVVRALLSNLERGSKIALITSQMGSLEDNTSGGYYGYRMSKAAMNMAGVCLARDLERAGVPVGLYHPGYVKTDMNDGRGKITPEESAAGLIARIDELSPERSGRFFRYDGTPIAF